MGLAILLEEAFLHCELDFQPTETRVTGMGYTDRSLILSTIL